MRRVGRKLFVVLVLFSFSILVRYFRDALAELPCLGRVWSGRHGERKY